mgnify:CR=1 FL=1
MMLRLTSPSYPRLVYLGKKLTKFIKACVTTSPVNIGKQLIFYLISLHSHNSMLNIVFQCCFLVTFWHIQACFIQLQNKYWIYQQSSFICLIYYTWFYSFYQIVVLYTGNTTQTRSWIIHHHSIRCVIHYNKIYAEKTTVLINSIFICDRIKQAWIYRNMTKNATLEYNVWYTIVWLQYITQRLDITFFTTIVF